MLFEALCLKNRFVPFYGFISRCSSFEAAFRLPPHSLTSGYVDNALHVIERSTQPLHRIPADAHLRRREKTQLANLRMQASIGGLRFSNIASMTLGDGASAARPRGWVAAFEAQRLFVFSLRASGEEMHSYPHLGTFTCAQQRGRQSSYVNLEFCVKGAVPKTCLIRSQLAVQTKMECYKLAIQPRFIPNTKLCVTANEGYILSGWKMDTLTV